MNHAYPESEEFLYCDPECVHDWISPCQQAHSCYVCYLADCHELEHDSRFSTVRAVKQEGKHEPVTA